MEKLIEQYRLEPHPEGGYFREVHRSDQRLESPVTGEKRNSVTHIYFLLLQGQVSRFHTVAHDEIWNFYQGDPLRLIRYDGQKIEQRFPGRTGQDFFSVVPAGVFQAAETTGAYSLVGCTVAPGFDFQDFSFLSDRKERAEALKKQFPDYGRFI